jgi:hypothetical protein
MTYTPDPTKGIEVYVDADFAGGWDPGDAMNADNVYSRTGYVIRYAGCPIYWQSKLQTEIALSTAEAEYIALSQALRETLPMTGLMKEINVIFPLFLPSPRFVIKVREDNQSCIAMAQNPSYCHSHRCLICLPPSSGGIDVEVFGIEASGISCPLTLIFS